MQYCFLAQQIPTRVAQEYVRRLRSSMVVHETFIFLSSIMLPINPIKPPMANIMGINNELDLEELTTRLYAPKMHITLQPINPAITLTLLLISNTSSCYLKNP